ncbi:MAG: hypothetical protein LBC74_10595 [Planctomycetaceae bacterium]|nr:hypothetical protein [Planctomycetaceae bacterium]
MIILIALIFKFGLGGGKGTFLPGGESTVPIDSTNTNAKTDPSRRTAA